MCNPANVDATIRHLRAALQRALEEAEVLRRRLDYAEGVIRESPGVRGGDGGPGGGVAVGQAAVPDEFDRCAISRFK